ncbi:winged helix-turn-helix domain-containing protein [Methylobacter tundripaludum]|uniref:winged helix-turn-helix domain-containing protein n=1 Tax=Methylobacter tundripaludum TaxID=173365 RepID=UPI00068E172B|nr:winged helix-turn-helix domain-containing protein [Methylobacter tundripaludum]
MQRSFPAYKEIEEPLLAFIFLNGGLQCSIRSDQSYDPLANYFSLSELDRIKTRNEVFNDGKHGETAWGNRVQWARRQLKKYGYLDSNAARGIWKLSEKGIAQANLISHKFGYFNPEIETEVVAVDIGEIEPAGRVETTTYRVLRDTPLARQLKLLHENKCQLCGKIILLRAGVQYSEAHHIMPLGAPHNGPDIAENIIVLCPNHHVECDYGAINLYIEKITSVPGHRVSEKYVEYHNRVIFKNA